MFSSYFTFSEFDSPDESGSGKERMDRKFLYKLTFARHTSRVPFVITSAFRTPSHNKKVGGVFNSSHTKGHAVDISVKTSKQRSIILKHLQDAGFNRFGIANTFLHVDDDPKKNSNRIWTY